MLPCQEKQDDCSSGPIALKRETDIGNPVCKQPGKIELSMEGEEEEEKLKSAYLDLFASTPGDRPKMGKPSKSIL